MSSSPLLPTEETEPSGLSRLLAVAPGVSIVVAMVAMMWAEEIVDLLPGTPFNRWGIRPRSVRGLFGIFLAPFLHVSFPHLIGNTIPFLLLGGVIALAGTRTIVEVTVIAGVVSGLGVWLFGASNSVHLGASGLVFGYLTYLVTRGMFARRVWWIVGGLVALAFYGGLFWGLLPRLGVSWLGHVFGAAGGVLAAYLLHADHHVDDDAADATVVRP